MEDKTYIVYDLKDNTLKRISSKIQETKKNKKICPYVIY